MGAASLVNMWNEGMCIDEETPPEGRTNSIREPGEIADEKSNGVP